MRFFILTFLMIMTTFTFAELPTTEVQVKFDPISTFVNSDRILTTAERPDVTYTFEYFCNDGINDASVKEHISRTTRVNIAYISLTPRDRFCYYRYRGAFLGVPGLWTDWFVKSFTAPTDVNILNSGRITAVDRI